MRKTMKRSLLICTLALILLALSFTSCGGKKMSAEDCGEEIIYLLDEMVNSDEYIEMYVSSSVYQNELKDTVDKLRKGDYSDPQAIYELSLENTDLADEFDGLPKDLESYMNSKYAVSFSSQINAAAGTTALMASSVFTASKSFVCDEIYENTVLLYVFEDGCPIVVSFSPGESDAVSVSATFILHEEFNADSEKDVERSCEELGIKGVEANKK